MRLRRSGISGSAPQCTTSARSGRRGVGRPRWSVALCVMAQRTPILLIGSEQQQESVFLDHIAAEFGGWLSSLGSRAKPKSLLEMLRRTVECVDAKRSAKPELCCHILTVAYIARVHALVSDIAKDVNNAVERSPIDHCIVHAQFSLPTSCEYAWYKEIITCVFVKYLDRLRELKESAGYEDGAFAVQSAAHCTSLMIESLVQQGPNDDIPQLMVTLLQMILPCFPSLYFSSETINGALRAVATERQMNTVSAGSVPLEIDPRPNASMAATNSAPGDGFGVPARPDPKRGIESPPLSSRPSWGRTFEEWASPVARTVVISSSSSNSSATSKHHAFRHGSSAARQSGLFFARLDGGLQRRDRLVGQDPRPRDLSRSRDARKPWNKRASSKSRTTGTQGARRGFHVRHQQRHHGPGCGVRLAPP